MMGSSYDSHRAGDLVQNTADASRFSIEEALPNQLSFSVKIHKTRSTLYIL